MTPFRPSPEIEALAAEIARWPVAASVDEEREAWRATCAELEAPGGRQLRPVDAGGVPACWAGEDGAAITVVYVHGGAFALGSPWHVRDLVVRLAAEAGARVLAVDYRLAPEHPYPAAHDDVLVAYRWLLSAGIDPGSIVLAGDSCGATLALATALVERPAGVAAISPWTDLTQSGWSYEANASLDPWITRDDLAMLADAFLDGADARAVSPLFGDLSSLPPLLVQVAAGEVLLSDALALVEAASRVRVPATLEVWPHAVHVWPVWATRLPEARAAIASIARFARDVAG